MKNVKRMKREFESNALEMIQLKQVTSMLENLQRQGYLDEKGNPVHAKYQVRYDRVHNKCYRSKSRHSIQSEHVLAVLYT